MVQHRHVQRLGHADLQQPRVGNRAGRAALARRIECHDGHHDVGTRAQHQLLAHGGAAGLVDVGVALRRGQRQGLDGCIAAGGRAGVGHAGDEGQAVDQLAANNAAGYDTWTTKAFSFSGTALSFDVGAGANAVALDNVSSVSEASSLLMMRLGGAAVLRLGSRRCGA